MMRFARMFLSYQCLLVWRLVIVVSFGVTCFAAIGDDFKTDTVVTRQFISNISFLKITPWILCEKCAVLKRACGQENVLTGVAVKPQNKTLWHEGSPKFVQTQTVISII